MEEAYKDQAQRNASDQPSSDKQDIWSKLKRNEQNSDGQGPGKKPPMRFSIWYFLSFFLILFLANSLFQQKPQTIEFSEFKQKIVSSEIKSVELGDSYYVGLPQKTDNSNNSNTSERKVNGRLDVYRTIPVDDPSFIPLLDKYGVEYYARPVTMGDMFGQVFFS